MELLFTILIIVGCVGIILFILVQNPKGGGLNTEFGSAVQLGGAKRATDILEKGTWGLAAAIAIFCLFMSVGTRNTGVVNTDDQVEEIETDMDNYSAPANDVPADAVPTQPIIPG